MDVHGARANVSILYSYKGKTDMLATHGPKAAVSSGELAGSINLDALAHFGRAPTKGQRVQIGAGDQYDKHIGVVR
jgi:hypothetical protein